MAVTDSLSEFHLSAVIAAHKAGKIIEERFYHTKQAELQGHGALVDMVTETEKECEDVIFNHLKQLYPNHKFIGTTAASGTKELSGETTWIVNPLDGRINFVHGFPFVCVSIGLTIGTFPAVGVVYNPIMDELFTGVYGKGAFLNGKPIEVSRKAELSNSLLATEVVTQCDKLAADDSTNRINTLHFKVDSHRMSGSRALNLCGVACGRLDAVYEFGLNGPWHVAGAAAIVTEAGGLVFDPFGVADFNIQSERVAASNPFLKTELVNALRQTG